MKNLVIRRPAGRFDIPEVSLNYKTGICEFTGESYPENSPDFYAPVIEWLNQYMFVEKKPIQVDFKLYYFNTSSSKALYDLLMMFKKYQDEGGKIIINWYCESDDIDLLEDVEDFIISTNIKINVIKYEN